MLPPRSSRPVARTVGPSGVPLGRRVPALSAPPARVPPVSTDSVPGTVHPSPWVGAAHFPTEVNLNVNKTSSSCFISRYCRYRTERSSTAREPRHVSSTLPVVATSATQPTKESPWTPAPPTLVLRRPCGRPTEPSVSERGSSSLLSFRARRNSIMLWRLNLPYLLQLVPGLLCPANQLTPLIFLRQALYTIRLLHPVDGYSPHAISLHVL